MAPLLTVVVPTYNRSDLLFRTLGFLQSGSVRVPIIVADGSDDTHARVNSGCSSLSDNISYFHLPTGTEEPIKSYFRRVIDVMGRLTTPYVVFCGDDDIAVVDNALRSAQFLEDNKDYVACHGSYLLFRYVGDAIQIEDIAYEGESIDGDEIGSRLMQLFSRYEAPYYAVFRVSTQRRLLPRCLDVEMPLWPETYHSTAAVVEGKIKRLDNIHCLRNIGIPAHHGHVIRNFGRWTATDLDGFLVRYRKFCESVIGWAMEKSDFPIGQDRLRRAIDMAFILYIGSEFDRTYWIDQYLETAIAGDSEKAKLRARLEQILFGRETKDTAENEKLAIFPLGDAFRSLIISMVKTLIGERGIRVIQSVKRRGLGGAIEDHRRSDRGWVQANSAWKLEMAPDAEQHPVIQVPGFLRKRFPQDQWDLLRNLSLRSSR
jgi:glycosyltransferase domain-containing protein